MQDVEEVGLGLQNDKGGLWLDKLGLVIGGLFRLVLESYLPYKAMLLVEIFVTNQKTVCECYSLILRKINSMYSSIWIIDIPIRTYSNIDPDIYL